MLGACVDLKLLDHLATKLITRKHAFNSVLNDELGLLGAHVAHVDVAFATHPAGVEHVVLVGVLFARYFNLLSVNHDDEVASVCVRRVGRLVATAEHIGNFYGNAAECLVGSIDHIPGFGVV